MQINNITKDNMVFTPCNLCGSNEYIGICDIEISPILTPSKLVKCKRCGFFYANPTTAREVEENYYRRNYYKKAQEGEWHEERMNVFVGSLRKISKFLKQGRLLDVGCGMGYFIDLARSKGWDVKGVEISDGAVEYAREKLNLDVVRGSLKDANFDTEYFDVAVMWNVLDQMHNPRANLKELNRILKKGGYLFIRVPNLYFHIKLVKFYKILKPFLRNVKRTPWVFHLYSFDKNSIKRLLRLTGFSNVSVRTEPLDINVPRFVEIFGKKREGAIRKLFDLGAKIVYFFSPGKIIISPSIFVVAKK